MLGLMLKGSSITKLVQELRLGLAIFAKRPRLLMGLLTGSVLTVVVVAAFNEVIELVSRVTGSCPSCVRPLIIAIGALASGIARKKCKHVGLTLPDALKVHKCRKRLDWSILFWVMLATPMLLGTGGSAGKEGPAAVLGLCLGGIVENIFVRSEDESVWLTVWGMACIIGALFNSPLAGAFFSCEITRLKGGDWRYLPGSLIGAAVSTVGMNFISGTKFEFLPHLNFAVGILSIATSVIVGLASGVVSKVYVCAITKAKSVTNRAVKVPGAFKPVIGGLMVGCLGLEIPMILGQGNEWLSGAWISGTAVGLVLLLPFVKIVATSLSVGTGGCGGVFMPSVVIGAFAGAAAHALLPTLPLELSMAIGMCAVVGSAAHCPLAGILITSTLVPESASQFVPLLLGLLIANQIVGSDTLYDAQD